MTAETARRVVVRLPRAQRVQDILDAALQVFSERGYGAAAVAEIAARAGVAEGTVYKYFESKRELLLRVVARWYESMLADYERELAGIQGTRNRLRFIVWRHLKAIHDYPALCRVFFLEIRAGDDYYRSGVYELNRRYTHFVIEILRAGMAAGEVKPEAPLGLVRDMIYGAVEHHTWNYVCGRGSLDIDRLADRLTDLLLGGLLQAPSEPARLDGLIARLERVVLRAEEGAP